MAKKESRSGGYEALRAAVKAGVPANLYIFYGEERYLLQTMAQRLKELLIPAGFEEFNYHRLTGKGLTVQELAETAEAMPMMAEHTLITVTDMDIFKLDEGQRTALIDLLSDFPPYCTLIFLYEQLTYKRDGKMKKLCAALNEYVQEVEFVQQERKDLLNWLKRRFAAAGHDIDQTGGGPPAVYLRQSDAGTDTGDREDRRLRKARAHHHGGHRRRGGARCWTPAFLT